VAVNGHSVNVSVDVTNTGARIGSEVVQVYLCDKVSKFARPIKELAGFEKVEIKPGETRKVAFTLGSEQLGYYAPCKGWVVEPGSFTIWVGGSSAAELTAEFSV
jgi:beta-glucosidase